MITVELEPELRDWLRERAEKHGVSLEEGALSLLRAAYDAAQTEAVHAEAVQADEARRRDERARWETLFALSVKLPPGSPSSTDIIRQMRDER